MYRQTAKQSASFAAVIALAASGLIFAFWLWATYWSRDTHLLLLYATPEYVAAAVAGVFVLTFLGSRFRAWRRHTSIFFRLCYFEWAEVPAMAAFLWVGLFIHVFAGLGVAAMLLFFGTSVAIATVFGVLGAFGSCFVTAWVLNAID